MSDHEEFFKKVGEGYLHPTEFGECFWSVTVENMYQAFKARMLEELRTPDPAPKLGQ